MLAWHACWWCAGESSSIPAFRRSSPGYAAHPPLAGSDFLLICSVSARSAQRRRIRANSSTGLAAHKQESGRLCLPQKRFRITDREGPPACIAHLGGSGPARFEAASASEFGGTGYDLACMFDCVQPDLGGQTVTVAPIAASAASPCSRAAPQERAGWS